MRVFAVILFIAAGLAASSGLLNLFPGAQERQYAALLSDRPKLVIETDPLLNAWKDQRLQAVRQSFLAAAVLALLGAWNIIHQRANPIPPPSIPNLKPLIAASKTRLNTVSNAPGTRFSGRRFRLRLARFTLQSKIAVLFPGSAEQQSSEFTTPAKHN